MLVVLYNAKEERGGLTSDVQKAASEKGSHMFSVIVTGEGVRS